VPDFWWYVAWGRVVVGGVNPYYTPMTTEMIGDLPLNAPGRDSGLSRFAYGPIWALVSGGAMWLAGGNGILAGALIKLLLAVVWLGSLRLIWLMLSERSSWRQCVGIAIVGWLPVSVLHSVADGHNDVLVLFLVLLWLYCLQRRSPIAGSLALAGSALVKYVTAPLFILDVLYLKLSAKRRLMEYLPQALAAATLAIIALGAFVRSTDAFSATLGMQSWKFFTPQHAVFELERLLKIKPTLFWFVPVVFPLLAVYFVARYLRRPGLDAFWKATLAVMCGVLFGIGHNWPWFLIWVLGPAALVAGSALTRWVVGVALAAPFAMLVLVLHRGLPPSSFDPWGHTGLGLYAFAVFWFALAPRRLWADPGPVRSEPSMAEQAAA
jgi:alpha-1,6-mannosyltransferase